MFFQCNQLSYRHGHRWAMADNAYALILPKEENCLGFVCSNKSHC